MFRVLGIVLLFFSSLVIATVDLIQRKDIQLFMQEMVDKHHFTDKELKGWFRDTTLQPSIIEAMNRPAEAKPWHQYRKIFLTSQQIENGVQFWVENHAALARAEKTYGVPAEVITAIIGIETRYGQNQGQYKVIDALSTLAFEYPARASFFRGELEQYLLLCREQGFDPLSLRGSYAGAMGIPQFIPSSYRHYAINFSQGQRANLFERVDAIGSVGHYFKEHGWQAGKAIASKASIVGIDYQKQLGHRSNPIANTTLKTLKEYGVTPHIAFAPDMLGTVIELEQVDQPEFWITFKNFYVITRYNHSSLYAMAAYQLSEEIRKAYEKK